MLFRSITIGLIGGGRYTLDRALGIALSTPQAFLIGFVAVLIGGCFSHRQIAPLFKAVLALGGAMPLTLVKASVATTPLALRVFEDLADDHIALMTQVLRDHSPRQIRWSCRALMRWECCATPPDMPIHAIHGQKDEIVPLRNVTPQRVIPGGHHLINLSHANEVNAFIADHIRMNAR